jgi:hypothetical protein
LGWRLSPEASLAYTRRFDQRGRRDVFRMRIFSCALARIGPIELVAGDRTGFPRPQLVVDQTSFPPLLRVEGSYRSYRGSRSYRLEVPIEPEAVAGVKMWIAEKDAGGLR